jgi:hypothetical protein
LRAWDDGVDVVGFEESGDGDFVVLVFDEVLVEEELAVLVD